MEKAWQGWTTLSLNFGFPESSEQMPCSGEINTKVERPVASSTSRTGLGGPQP